MGRAAAWCAMMRPQVGGACGRPSWLVGWLVGWLVRAWECGPWSVVFFCAGQTCPVHQQQQTSCSADIVAITGGYRRGRAGRGRCRCILALSTGEPPLRWACFALLYPAHSSPPVPASAGEELQRVRLPVQRPTACTFGGPGGCRRPQPASRTCLWLCKRAVCCPPRCTRMHQQTHKFHMDG